VIGGFSTLATVATVRD